MIYLIKELKFNTYYCGCEDFSEFNEPYNLRFGSEDDAINYYLLEHALDDIEYILKHDNSLTRKDFAIYDVRNNTTLTLKQAVEKVLLDELRVTNGSVGEALLRMLR